MRRALALAACMAAAGMGCRGEQGPTAGELSVRLAAPLPNDRAVLFVVTGRLHGVTAGAGSAYRVFADTSGDGDTAHVAVVAPPGSGLDAGEVARVRVDDTRKVASYAVRVVDAATASYRNGDTSGVVLTVVRP
jgi:hypothetical protein